MKCDQIQGYLFSRPLPAVDFVQLLGRGRIELPVQEAAR
jgi:EAL domain-containing protein (putative c-di-GMP-specific phosphodiesterase class I)